MIPTVRLLVLLLAAAPLALLAHVAMGAVWTAVVLAAAVADALLAGDLGRVRVDREDAGTLSLGEWNPITLRLRSAAGRTLALRVRDVSPPGMETDPPLAGGGDGLRVALPPGGEATLVYRLRPVVRGDFRFGDVHLRAPGPLGLVLRQRRVAGTGAACQVFPSLRALRRFDLLVRRGALLDAGIRPVRAPGAGTEFERLREYLPDDDPRRINWKATARRAVPIVNQLQTERSQNLVILLDTGRLMAAPAAPSPASPHPGLRPQGPDRGASSLPRRPSPWPSAIPLPQGERDKYHHPAIDVLPFPALGEGKGKRATFLAADALVEGEAPPGLTKLDYAVNTALLLAHVASGRDDRLALLAYADRVREFLPPQRGKQGMLRMLHSLYHLQPEPVEADHALAFQYLAAHRLRRSLVVLFTDLADRESSAALAAHLTRAARSHQAVCVTLRDPAVGALAEAAPEDGDGLYAQAVAQQLLDERAQVLAGLRHAGVLTVDTDAAALSPQVISAYLELKQRGRG